MRVRDKKKEVGTVLAKDVIENMPNSDLPIWAQFLSTLSGLSGIVALVVLLHSHLSGPNIKCSAFRHLLIGHIDNNSLIGTTLLFTNFSLKSGAINTMFITLQRQSDENEQMLIYYPYTEGLDPNHIPEGLDPNHIPFNYASKLSLPFMLPSNSSATKDFLFLSQKDFKFKKGKYIMNLYCRLAEEKKNKKLSTRIIDLQEDIEDNSFLTTVDPLGTDEVFTLPYEGKIDAWSLFK